MDKEDLPAARRIAQAFAPALGSYNDSGNPGEKKLASRSARLRRRSGTREKGQDHSGCQGRREARRA